MKNKHFSKRTDCPAWVVTAQDSRFEGQFFSRTRTRYMSAVA